MFKMYKGYVQGLIFMAIIGVNLTHILTSTNDWVPISRDEVLRRLSRLNRRNVDTQFQHVNNEANNNDKYNTKATVPNNFSKTNNENAYTKNAIRLVQPVKLVKLDQTNAFYPVVPDTITSVNDLQNFSEENKEQETRVSKVATTLGAGIELEKSFKTKDDTIETNLRKPKAIAVKHNIINTIEDDEVSSVKILENDKERKEKESNHITTQENRKNYQVTEETIDALEEEQSSTEERTGYFYTPPKIYHGNSMENNLTNIFLDILSKQNIHPDDDLPNYSLSRRQMNHNPLSGYMLIPIPLRVLSQYNNLNLDPLAILLSNYGYYLPGSYGIRGKYRNLYGSLASNNIHNNKPFGSYKIFSDTDSSN